MDYKEIGVLLKKYLDGESSLGEEKILGDYFRRTNDIPKELIYAKIMFANWNVEEQLQYPRYKKHKTVKVVIAVAASIVLMFGIVFNASQDKKETIYCYVNGEPVTDQVQAVNEVREALCQVSKNLNRAADELELLSKFHESTLLISTLK